MLLVELNKTLKRTHSQDLKWPGIVQNAAGTEGVDAGKTIGRYTGTDGKEHNITQCTDLSKYAPKVKMGGLCDANDECESGLCVNWVVVVMMVILSILL